MASRYLFLLASLLVGTQLAHACKECQERRQAELAALELLPKASQLHPEAKVVEYNLDISEETLAPAGKSVQALVLNGGAPGPVLRFREGEIARIHVHNKLQKEETSVHWHGVLVPNLEDGVSHITTPPIRAGESRTFEFLLKHPGTYWYHSHTGLQEQRAVYGPIVVEPKADAPARSDIPHVDREEVIVFSDWTNERPNEVMRTLLRGSEWYAIRKGTAQSLFGAIGSGHFRDYVDREWARLPAMDLSDVAYDAFLANGAKTQRLKAAPGETIKLRVINAAAASYFYLTSAAGPLTIIASDGMDVVPIHQNRLLIGMGETYDLLITIPRESVPAAWEFRATAQDNSGHTSVFLGTDDAPVRTAPALAKPELYGMDEALGTILDEMDGAAKASDDEALASEKDRPLSPYKRLRATHVTTLPASAPARELTMHLTGDMQRYLWSLNGKPIHEQSTIPVKKGEVLRLVLVNDTMMHHPMHLHGHFFRLLMPGGAPVEFAPLKHTVDVPPMSRRVIEFYANEDQDWLFHCHLLYHNMSGMARVVSYPAGEKNDPTSSESVSSSGADAKKNTASYKPSLGEHAHAHGFAWIEGTVQSQMSDGLVTIQHDKENYNLNWEVGWERVPSREYEIDATYSHYFNSHWTAFLGYRLTNMEEGRDCGIAGATYRLPLMFDLTAMIKTDGEARFALRKDLMLTSRLHLMARAEYDTAQEFNWNAELSYVLTKQFSLVGSYDEDYGAGAGIGFRF